MKCAHDTHLSRLDPRKLLCVARCRRRRRRCCVWRPRHGERWWRRAAPVRSHRRRGRLLLLLQIACICQGCCGNNWRRACRCCRYSGGRRRGFRCSPLSLKIIMLLLVASCTTTSICCGGILLEISGSGSSGRCSRGRRGCLSHLPLCIKVIHVICTTRHTHTHGTRAAVRSTQTSRVCSRTQITAFDDEDRAVDTRYAHSDGGSGGEFPSPPAAAAAAAPSSWSPLSAARSRSYSRS